MIIQNYGTDERCRTAARLIAEWLGDARVGEAVGGEQDSLGGDISESCNLDRALGIGRVIILPIPSARRGVAELGCAESEEEIISAIDGETLLVGYSVPTAFSSAARERGAVIYDAALDEAFLRGNAELTAEAMLGILLTESKRSLSELCVGIFGWGRIGSRLGSKLLFLGSRITVFTSSEDKRIELGKLGIATREASEEALDLSGIDVVINTAPKRLISEGALVAAGYPTLYDLASGGATDGLTGARLLPSLPTRFYPESAGRLYAEGVLRVLGSEDRYI